MIFEIENYESLRRAVDRLCAFLSEENVPEERIFDSKLVAYELLGNVLKHATGGAKFCGEIYGEYVQLKIHGSQGFCPPRRGNCADVYAENGRGLFLVDSVCAERICTDDGGIVVRIKITQ